MKKVIQVVIGVLVLIRAIVYLSKTDDYGNLLFAFLIITVLVAVVYLILGKVTGDDEQNKQNSLVIPRLDLKEKYPYTETIGRYLLICNDEKFIIKKDSENLFHFDKETKLIQIDIANKTKIIESWDINSIVLHFQRKSAKAAWVGELFVKRRTTNRKLKVLELTFRDENITEKDIPHLNHLMAFVETTDIADIVSFELNKPYNKPVIRQ